MNTTCEWSLFLVRPTSMVIERQSIASNTCRETMSVFTEEIRRLDDRLEEVRALAKEAVKVVRQASADPQVKYRFFRLGTLAS